MKEFEVSLPDGKTLKGASYPIEDPKKRLLIQTGMCEHATRYERFALFLNEKGYDVFVLDAFGQGLNAASVEAQQIWPENAFALNVDALNIEINELRKAGLPVYLMGHSMGSFMVQSYLERYPGTADKIVICGSNGPAKAKMAFGHMAAKMLVTNRNRDKTGKMLQSIGLGGYSKAIKGRKTDFDWISYNEDNVKAYIDDPYCGHPNTNGFWYEFLKGMDTLYRKKNLRNIDVNEHILLVAGKEDPVGECGKGVRRLYDMYRELGVKDVQLKLYDKMRHEILNEKDHAIVDKDILDFLEA